MENDQITISRRGILGVIPALATTFASVVSSRASSSEPFEDLAIRDDITGVDPRFNFYWNKGEQLYLRDTISYRPSSSHQYMVFSSQSSKPGRLVVFSHGVLSSPLDYKSMMYLWASHGFIVICPVHEDAVISKGGALRTQETGTQFGTWPFEKILDNQDKWAHRSRDCTHVFDLVGELEGILERKILTDRPIIAGHEFGAFIASLLLGATVEADGAETRSYMETRFFASLLFGPPGPGILKLNDESWSKVQKPLYCGLTMTDLDFTQQEAIVKQAAYKLSAPNYKHLFVARHGNQQLYFGSQKGKDENVTAARAGLMGSSVAFLRAYGNYENAAFQDLTTNFFERMTLGAITERRR
ncbi:hypothetical protein ACQU0X_26985 [Pseudovibrio ascidiaceicola]|uniref:hypothetical protein n=1 Tax=Pseudovibrio ascidiaceicola TaxID=285279 RepID=UPI003D35EAE8